MGPLIRPLISLNSDLVGLRFCPSSKKDSYKKYAFRWKQSFYYENEWKIVQGESM